MQAKTQNDLVMANLLNKEDGRETTENVEVIGIEDYFNKIPFSGKGKTKVEPKTSSLRLPNLKILHEKTRQEVAQVLLTALDQRGVVGFEWKVGKDALVIYSLDGFQQKVLSDMERASLETVLTNALKSRRNITGLKWEFGKRTVELTYIF